MTWTWDDEKTLGVGHLDKMAALNRQFEANRRDSAERNLAHAEQYRLTAERFERAAREVRGEAAADLPPVRHKTMCGVATASGLPCTRGVPHEGDFCWQHDQARDAGAPDATSAGAGHD